MAREEIVIEIDPETGAPTVSVNGVQGPGCVAWTADIIEAYGGAKETVHKREYTQAAPAGGARNKAKQR